MKRMLKRLAAVGLVASLLPALAASPASALPGAQDPPTVTPNPVALAADNFALSNGTCDGSGTNGWRVQTFIVNDGVNVGSLVFDQGPGFDQVGTDRDNSNGSIASPLWKDNAPGTGYNPSSTGLINPTDLSNFDFSNTGWVLTDGQYQIGYVCLDPASNVSQWWARTVTIDPTPGGGSSFMAMGVPAPAPTIVGVTPANGQLIIDFSGTGADSWTAQATTTSGDYSSPVGTSTTVTSETNDITISGLTNATTYFVRVLANKATFAPAASTEATASPGIANPEKVQDLAVTDSGTANNGFVDIDWNPPAPVAGCNVTGYTVTSSPSGTVAQPDPDYTGAKTNSARITGLPSNQTINASVTPQYGPGCSPQTPQATATVQGFIVAGNIVVQNIDVTRPVGALVLTQVCGNYGALPGEGVVAPSVVADQTFLGADNTDTPGTRDDQDLSVASVGFDYIGAIPAASGVHPSTVDQPWLPGAGAPYLTADPALGTADDAGGRTTDVAKYPEYPYPTTNGAADPSPATHCGVQMGVAEFVTVGDGAGQYFAAQARLNQITVVDTRNVDAGWTLSGSMSDFVAQSFAGDGTDVDGLDSFSGDFLGWTPVVSENTSGFDHDADPDSPDYDQEVVAGARVEPNTNLGLGDGAKKTLARGLQDKGLGTAILDARLKLLIPVNADAGLYEGDLTFSAL